ncbi:MGMT family protein [Ignicoccus hospitalis]|uniref:MGMT family protein n=1 Tax=Ignicoccus hospitalis TaxID=160233 RepID=UPI0011D0C218|nr:MGMT family protein [Ignicoccus hospitalis]HIH90306.1 MGMT family protein [Desulfurococcaceae archaeon]
MRRLELLKELLLLIPLGKVTTYSSLASLLGTHPRAVGAMLARNEDLVVYPCHRVVMSDGRLGGYALGKEFKRRLLELEGVKFCGPERVCKESVVDLKELLS